MCDMGDKMSTLMYEHEIAWCKKVIANGAKGDDLKATQERLERAEAGKAAMEKKIAQQNAPKKRRSMTKGECGE